MDDFLNISTFPCLAWPSLIHLDLFCKILKAFGLKWILWNKMTLWQVIKWEMSVKGSRQRKSTFYGTLSYIAEFELGDLVTLMGLVLKRVDIFLAVPLSLFWILFYNILSQHQLLATWLIVLNLTQINGETEWLVHPPISQE